jgi:putative membrane protein
MSAVPPALWSALASAGHILAFGLGLPSIWARAFALQRGDVASTLKADNIWGVAAVLWLVTGLLRAFGGLEKGSAWYLANDLFWWKMGLFGLIWVLEAWPMVTLIRWRITRTPDPARMPLFARISFVEGAITLILPFLAAAMARGIGM